MGERSTAHGPSPGRVARDRSGGMMAYARSGPIPEGTLPTIRHQGKPKTSSKAERLKSRHRHPPGAGEGSRGNGTMTKVTHGSAIVLALPPRLASIAEDQRAIPKIAKDPALLRLVEEAIHQVPTRHDLFVGDARRMESIADRSVHLIVTSPPYWTLKDYRDSPGQMGHINEYESFLEELDKVWRHCYRVLVPGGRVVCVVGDVCLSRRENAGRHTVVPLHASIQEHCRRIGFDNLAPIIWYKIANAVYEVERGGGGFLGKPYEPNGVIKNDIEFILMERKPGGYRTPDFAARLLSTIGGENHQLWFQQIWNGVTGASTRNHPAPFPIELASRLVRMFSFVGDTVLDPFMGTGTTSVAAASWGRNSIGIEVDPQYFELAAKRIRAETRPLFERSTTIIIHPTREAVADGGS